MAAGLSLRMVVASLLVVSLLLVAGGETRSLRRFGTNRRPSLSGHLPVESQLSETMDSAPRQDVIERPDLSTQEEPTLFELLVSALSESDAENGEKRTQLKQSKPCYWSLVSCY